MLGSHTQLLGLKASSNHAAKFLKKVLKLKLYQWAKRWPSGLDTDRDASVPHGISGLGQALLQLPVPGHTAGDASSLRRLRPCHPRGKGRQLLAPSFGLELAAAGTWAASQHMGTLLLPINQNYQNLEGKKSLESVLPSFLFTRVLRQHHQCQHVQR